jgi:hypothetical protein
MNVSHATTISKPDIAIGDPTVDDSVRRMSRRQSSRDHAARGRRRLDAGPGARLG